MARVLGSLLALLLALAGPSAGAAAPAGTAPEVTGLRYGVEGGRTLVTLDLDRPVAFRTLVVPRPQRLVVDLPEVEWRPRPGGGNLPRGLVTGQQHGLFAAGRTRLVLDVAAPFRVAQQRLVPPTDTGGPGGRTYRLVLELEPLAPFPPVAVAALPAAAPPATATTSRPSPVPLARPAAAAPPPARADVPPVVAVPRPTSEPPAATAATPRLLPPVVPEIGGPPVAALPSAVAAPGEASQTAALVVPPPPPSDAAPDAGPRRLPVVVIDPGHGGVDPGTVGVGGVLEKAVVLEAALALRDALERTGRYRVALTRDGDTFLRLRERVARAREVEGDVFVSLHADSWSAPNQRGASVYTLSATASDEEAGRLASKENKSDILAGTDLSHHDPVVASILIDLAQRDTSNRSIGLADLVAEELADAAPAVPRGRRFAGFAVLKSPDVPSVLLELGYLSNPEEAHNLSQPAYRAGLAAAVLRALDRYFARNRS